jgi:hypothetical protein
MCVTYDQWYVETDNTMAKRKSRKDKQWSTKHAHKTQDRVTKNPLKSGVNSGAPEGWAVPAPLVPSC